jgi:hypothetical protein
MVQKGLGKGLHYRGGRIIVPQQYMEKLKGVPVLLGHERCASSQFGPAGTVIICAVHGYHNAAAILADGRYYFGCRDCIETECDVTAARTEPNPRGPFVQIKTEEQSE